MKVLVVANEREGSRSWKVVKKMMEGAEAAGHEVKLYAMNRMPLLGCQNCRSCRTHGVDCVLNDALKPYWEDLHTCGAVIVGAPNYNSQPSGAMITFMNRHYCMLDANKQPRLDHDVKLLTVFAQGAPVGYGSYESNYEWFRSCFKTKRLIASGSINVGGDSDLAEDGQLMQDAFRMGKEL